MTTPLRPAAFSRKVRLHCPSALLRRTSIKCTVSCRNCCPPTSDYDGEYILGPFPGARTPRHAWGSPVYRESEHHAVYAQPGNVPLSDSDENLW